MLTLVLYWQAGFKGHRCWQTKGIQKSMLSVGIPMAHFCSWAQQSASRGPAWVSWAPPYASEMAALIVMTPAAAALVDRSVTSDIPRDHRIGHVLYLPVLPRWCKLLSSFTASIILLPQQLPPLREGRTTHFLVYPPYINWHWLPVWIWFPCTHLAMDGEGSMWFQLNMCVASLVRVGACHMWISNQWRKLGTKQLRSKTLQRLFLCKFSDCKTRPLWHSFKKSFKNSFLWSYAEKGKLQQLLPWSNLWSHSCASTSGVKLKNVASPSFTRKKLFCQTFFKTVLASPGKLLHQKSRFINCFKRSWSYAKRGLKFIDVFAAATGVLITSGSGSLGCTNVTSLFLLLWTKPREVFSYFYGRGVSDLFDCFWHPCWLL